MDDVIELNRDDRELSIELIMLVCEGDTDLVLVRPSTELWALANLEDTPEVLAGMWLLLD